MYQTYSGYLGYPSLREGVEEEIFTNIEIGDDSGNTYSRKKFQHPWEYNCLDSWRSLVCDTQRTERQTRCLNERDW